jgi:putative FmdB family regulatory protein
MPIYEFRCEHCQHEFETLVLGREAITCPDCESDKLTRLLSTFSHKSGDTFVSSKGSGCGG